MAELLSAEPVCTDPWEQVPGAWEQEMTDCFDDPGFVLFPVDPRVAAPLVEPVEQGVFDLSQDFQLCRGILRPPHQIMRVRQKLRCARRSSCPVGPGTRQDRRGRGRC